MQGGIKAVVWTDVVQASVMVVSIVLVACYGVAEVGGVAEVWNRAVAGGRISPPEYEYLKLFLFYLFFLQKIASLFNI